MSLTNVTRRTTKKPPTSKIMRYKQSYNPIWETTLDWLLPVDNDEHKGFCRICNTALSCHGGLNDLQKHTTSSKHEFYFKNSDFEHVKVKSEEVPLPPLIDYSFELHMEEICRICLKRNDNMYSIFDEDDSELSFADKIMQTSTLMIEKESDLLLPMLICPTCISNLEVAFSFRMTCESSDTVLQLYAPSKPIITMDPIEEEARQELYCASPIRNEDDFEIFEDQTRSQPVDLTEIIKPALVYKRVRRKPGRSPPPSPRPKKTYICDQCGMEFKIKTRFTQHLWRHMDLKPYKCHYCEKGFRTKTNIIVHLRIHTGEKPYSCSYCPKKFSDCSVRLGHERVVHTGEKKFVCEICKKAFAYSSVLKRHRLLHMGVKNYFCRRCKKPFTTSSNLRQHENVHAKQLGMSHNEWSRSHYSSPKSGNEDEVVDYIPKVQKYELVIDDNDS